MSMAIVGRWYRHFKRGGLYEVIALARDADTLEDLVVYRSLDEPRAAWVRTRRNFEGGVPDPTHPTRQVERFALAPIAP